jgi:hypothetical protein
MEVSGKLHEPAALIPGKGPGKILNKMFEQKTIIKADYFLLNSFLIIFVSA